MKPEPENTADLTAVQYLLGWALLMGSIGIVIAILKTANLYVSVALWLDKNKGPAL